MSKKSLTFLKENEAPDNNTCCHMLVRYNFFMGLVSLFMTLINIFTAEYVLMWATAIFAVLCPANVFVIRRNPRLFDAFQHIFLIEALALCSFFCLSGIPEGFSALWICFIPSFAVSMMGIRRGSVYSAVGFLVIITLFWLPWGRGLLMYAYNESFLLRFPIIYVAFYGMALQQESLRVKAQQQMLEQQRNYYHLYRHDALTGLYNRYGFNEKIDESFEHPEKGSLTLMMLDQDVFKSINDTYGHRSGDKVLRNTACVLHELGGEEAVACRWGGEEFILMMRNCPDPAVLAEQIRCRLESAEVIADDGRTIRYTVSIGVCSVADITRVTIADVVSCADHNLYAAKGRGRNTVQMQNL